MDYLKKIEKAKSFADIFEIVQKLVMESLGSEQAGLMVGVSDLGNFENGFIGAFYSPNSNMIVINKRPLARIIQTNPMLYNYYVFHVMLHEYVHAVGYYDEIEARTLVHEISKSYFGKNHLLTELAADISRFFPNLSYPGAGYTEPDDINIEFVKGIDRKNINYIN